MDLEGYRAWYALYKSDKNLQRMHALCPWLLTWDDHEVEGDYGGATKGTADLAARRAAAYQAYYEHMPLRASAMIDGLAGLQALGALRIYSRVDFGPLATFHVLDVRQYRDAPQSSQVPQSDPGIGDFAPAPENLSMLGEAQEAWLERGLAKASHQGNPWTIIAQQTVFTPRTYQSGWGTNISSRAGITQRHANQIAEQNPHARLANCEWRGYGVVKLPPRGWCLPGTLADDGIGGAARRLGKRPNKSSAEKSERPIDSKVSGGMRPFRFNGRSKKDSRRGRVLAASQRILPKTALSSMCSFSMRWPIIRSDGVEAARPHSRTEPPLHRWMGTRHRSRARSRRLAPRTHLQRPARDPWGVLPAGKFPQQPHPERHRFFPVGHPH
jgi:PhoD-like phosphatase